MAIQWNTTTINPQDLIQISRGNNEIVYKYLQQFQELIPQRIVFLEKSLKAEDRKKVRQILHQMSPQLQFFGIKDMMQALRRLELEYSTMPLEDLSSLVNTVVNKLNMAIKDVEIVLKENF